MTKVSNFELLDTKEPFQGAALIQLKDSKILVMGQMNLQLIYEADLKKTPLEFKAINGLPQDIEYPEAQIPNAILHNGRYVYTFGDFEHPYAFKYDCKENKIIDLNPKDKNLEIATKHKISTYAKTQLLGNEHIVICSKQNDLLIYSIKLNKFVHCYRWMFRRNSNFDMDVFTSIGPYKEGKQVYFAVNMAYEAFITLDTTKKHFGLVVDSKKNSFCSHFYSASMTLIPQDQILICMGGRNFEGSRDEIIVYNIKNNKWVLSKIKLPEKLFYHSVIYIKSENYLYLIGGCNNRQTLDYSNKCYRIDYKIFEKDIQKITS